MDKGRGTPPPGDGRGKPPPGDGRGTPPPGDHRGAPPSGDPPRWNPFAARKDGEPSAQAKGSLSGGEEHAPPSKRPQTWAMNWYFFKYLHIGPVFEKVKSVLAPSSAPEFDDPESLPGLSVYKHVVYGPKMSREEEAEFLQRLDYLLMQLQAFLRENDVEPVELNDLNNVNEIPTRTVPRPIVRKSYSEILSRWQLFGGPSSYCPKSEALPSESDSDLLKNRELVNAIRKFSANMKSTIAVGVSSSYMSDEFAKVLLLRMYCLDINMKKMMNSSGRCFTFDGLVNKLTIPTWVKTGSGAMMFYLEALKTILTMAECCVDNAGTSPVHFSSIAKESSSLLTEDFCFKQLKLNSDPYERVSFAIGGEKGVETFRQLMMKVKGGNRSFFLLAKSVDAPVVGAVNAAANGIAAAAAPHIENDLVCTKLSFSKICGKDLKGIIHFPFPSLNAKVDIHGLHPYCAYSGGIGFHRANAVNGGLQRYATLNFSGLFGVKCFGAGGQVSFDTEQGRFICAGGIDIRTSLYTLLPLSPYPLLQ